MGVPASYKQLTSVSAGKYFFYRVPGNVDGKGDKLKGAHFSPCFSGFPGQMTLFPNKMTLLIQDTLILTAEWNGCALAMAEKRGRQHYYKGRSAGTRAGGGPGKGGREKAVATGRHSGYQ
jgi:hypothetical protein